MLTQNQRERIRALGCKDMAWWERLAAEESEELLARALDHEEKVVAWRKEWLPKLQDYETLCREKRPKTEALSSRQQTEYDILRDEMAFLKGRGDAQPHRGLTGPLTFIVETTLIGIAAAREIFSEKARPVVILTEEESQHWFKDIYPHGEHFGWYEIGRWLIGEGTDNRWLCEHSLEVLQKSHPLPAGCTYWTTYYGTAHGSLASSHTCDVWFWNGREAIYSGWLYQAQA